MRTQTQLNFDWLYIKKSDYLMDKSLKNKKFEKVNIPHSNVITPLANFSEEIYQFESIYIKKFEVSINKDKRYFILFDGVGHEAKVYLNDKFVGEHKGGYTAFKFEVTNLISSNNELRVEVNSKEDVNFPPFGKTIDYLTYGGIYREVTLIETPKRYIEDVIADQLDVLNSPKLKLDILTSNYKGNINVLIKHKHKEIYEADFIKHKDIVINFPFKLWDIDQPNLYEIIISTDEDSFSFKYGFREIEFKYDGFYLNGKHLKIVGHNRHQIYPYVGYAMPKKGQYDDAYMLKKIGNAVRTSHYPQSKHFIDKCDEIGLLVFTEAPGWQYVGDKAWQENYLVQVEEMVKTYKNHPSIILWGVRVNESGDYHELYSKSNILARSLDSRPTGGVRCFNYSETLEDVYTYNDFFHNGTNTYLKPIEQVLKTNHPYLITEYMGHMFPTKAFDNSERQIKHSLRHAHILNDVYGNNRISGSFGWAFIDYYTHKQFGSGDHICHHGIYDIFRYPKPAAKVYESQFADKPYLEVINYTDIGDFDAGYMDKLIIASNCEYIDIYQDDKLVQRYYPNIEEFKHLKHPLYIIDHFYGDAYTKQGFTKNEENEIISLAHSVAKRGGQDKILEEENIDYKKLNIGWDMYGKHIANWGSDTFTYKLVGSFKQKEITKVIGPYDHYEIKITQDRKKLLIEDTYDVDTVLIEAIDTNGNLRNYAFDAFEMIAEGSIEIIGDRHIGLIAGRRRVWVKTKHTGPGKLIIKSDSFNKVLLYEVS